MNPTRRSFLGSIPAASLAAAQPNPDPELARLAAAVDHALAELIAAEAEIDAVCSDDGPATPAQQARIASIEDDRVEPARTALLAAEADLAEAIRQRLGRGGAAIVGGRLYVDMYAKPEETEADGKSRFIVLDLKADVLNGGAVPA